MKNKVNNLFDFLKEITYNKSPVEDFTDEEFKNHFNTFLIHRYISMNIDYIELVNYVQGIPGLDKKQIYIIYKDLLPKSNRFLKYIGSKKSKTTDELAKNISLYYECGLKEAKEYADLLTQDMKTTILNKYGLTVEEINKIINYETNTSVPTARTSKKRKNN